MQEPRLTPTSFIVLGLLDWAGESTPYRLKQLLSVSVGNFWTLQHAQLYSEPERLAAGGYVTEEREQGGRRRRLYAITERGRRALREWRSEPVVEIAELRDKAILKLFFGADPAVLAPPQLETHEAKLAEYERLREGLPADTPAGVRLALDSGIQHERHMVRWWRGVIVQHDGDGG